MEGAGKHEDILGGFAHWVEVLLLQETLWVLDTAEHDGEKQGGRKSHS